MITIIEAVAITGLELDDNVHVGSRVDPANVSIEVVAVTADVLDVTPHGYGGRNLQKTLVGERRAKVVLHVLEEEGE